MFLTRHPINRLKRRWRLLFVSGVITGLLSLLATLLFPLEYRADAQVLIISKSRYGVDPYTVVKSAERVGENIAQVVKTDDFFNKVVDNDQFVIERSRFEGVNERQRRRRWQRAVKSSVVYGTGILNVSAYHPDQARAVELAAAVVNTLAAKGWEYVGGDVTIKVVNQPLVTRWPARPNLFLNGLAGFLVGGLAMGALAIQRHS